MEPNWVNHSSSFSWVLASVSPAPKPFFKISFEQCAMDVTYNVDRSSPSIRLSLHWPDPPDVSSLLIDSKERISSLSLNNLLESLNNEWDTVSLKLPHPLESQDSLDRNPSVLVERGQGEEVSVDGKVGIGEVEVDYLSVFCHGKSG